MTIWRKFITSKNDSARLLLLFLLHQTSLPSSPNLSCPPWPLSSSIPTKEPFLTSQTSSKTPTQDLCSPFMSLSLSSSPPLVFPFFGGYFKDVSLCHQPRKEKRPLYIIHRCVLTAPQRPWRPVRASDVSALLLKRKTQVASSSSAPGGLVS